VAAEVDPIELATRSLRHRDRSRHEIDERLAKAGVGARERADALRTLERVGYLDDGRFAATRAAALASRGQGDRAIRFELGGHGLSAEQVEAALATLAPEAERAAGLADRLGRSPKTAAHLSRKGFSLESLETALGPGLRLGMPEE
jgi:regulatory protein